jgi:RNA polymerase sigma factor for flagellar operon FliA
MTSLPMPAGLSTAAAISFPAALKGSRWECEEFLLQAIRALAEAADSLERSCGRVRSQQAATGPEERNRIMKNTAQADSARQDTVERDRILLEQLPQVRYLARRMHERLPRQVPLEDLVHAGVIGLIDALNKFDHSKHVQFGSYAKFRIRGAMLDSLREMDWGPRELRRKGRRVEEAERKLSLDLSRAPTEMEVAAELHLELREFQQLLTELDGLEVGSLHLESPWDGKEEDLCDYLPNAPEDTPFFRCMRSEMKGLLARAVADLPEKEQQVLALYYFEELTMKEVGAVLGIGESRVSQIHSLAVVRLRGRLEELMTTTKPAAKPAARAAQAGGS